MTAFVEKTQSSRNAFGFVKFAFLLLFSFQYCGKNKGVISVIFCFPVPHILAKPKRFDTCVANTKRSGACNANRFNFCLLRFLKIMVIYPKWKVPFANHTYFLEQTSSVISNSFISFFKHTLLRWHVPYSFMTPLLISQAHFCYFCNTCFFLKFRNISDVARRNIFF